MSLIFRKPWTSQPQGPTINSGKLSPWVLFNFANGIAPPNFGTQNCAARNWTVGATSIVTATPYGIGLKTGLSVVGQAYGGTRAFDLMAPASSPVWFALSVVHGAYVNQGSSLNLLVSLGSVDSSVGFAALATSANVLNTRLSNTNLVGPTLVAGQRYNIVFGRDAVGACWLWVNGLLAASGTGATAALSAVGATQLTLGGDGLAVRAYQGSIQLFAMGSENPEQFGQNLSANPWQLFAPVQSFSRTLSAIAAPVTDAITGTISRSRKPWTSQPQGPVGIDWGNPLSRGLLGAFLPASPINIVDGVQLNKIGTFALSPRYTGVAVSGGAYEYPAPVTAASLGAKFDLAVLSALTYTSQTVAENNNQTFFRGNGSSAPHWECGVNGGTFNGPETKIGTYSYGPSTTGLSTLTPRITVLTADGTTATTYYDGAFVNSAAYTPPTYVYDAANHRALTFGSVNGISSQQNTRPTLGLFWNRALSAAEVKIISANPWQLFAPVQSFSRTLLAIDTSINAYITSATTKAADTSAGVITPIAQIPSNINPIYTRVADIQGGILLGNIATTISTGSAATDYTGQSQHNIPIFTADATNGGYVQKIRFKAAGTNVAAIAKIYLNEGKLNTVSPAGTPGTPTGAPSTTGGTLQPGSYYAKVQAIDSWGGFGILSGESAAIVITTTLGSIVWSWTAATGPVAYYRVYVGTGTGGEYSYFDATPGALTYTQTAPFITGQFANPIDNTTANMFIGEIVLPPSTASNVTPNIDIDYPINRALPPGYRILVGLHSTATLASGWVATVFGGKY